jgi:chemotaxis protein histidine kinase CheA
MFNSDFNPYDTIRVHQEELERQHEVINQLIIANNNLNVTMLELAQQHQSLVGLNSALRRDLETQRMEIRLLKTRAQI